MWVVGMFLSIQLGTQNFTNVNADNFQCLLDPNIWLNTIG